MRNAATTPLKKAKLRMSMSKFNLYNLSRAFSPTLQYRNQNFFKQKWVAKSNLRDYHGENIRENQWTRMFSRRLRSVVPMNPAYLARNDGSLESAGRGSGLEAQGRKRVVKRTPYMLQTFAPVERRLDVAIFRALFASSARQARQFVVHGCVKVNGKPMRYPGYLLNPGDMFQVTPDRVLYAMGAPKEIDTSSPVPAAEEPAEEDAGESNAEAEEAEVDDRTPKEVLKSLLQQSRTILSTSKEGLSAKRKQDLRAFSKGVKKLMAKAGRSEVETDSVEAQLQEIQEQLRLARESKDAGTSSMPSEQSTAQRTAATDSTSSTDEAAAPRIETPASDDGEFGRRDANTIQRALQMMSLNPVDESKPYATPWTPRNYLSAFAFIPRYLEVNQNICAAVYLRHPVARPGMSEVPSPFSEAANANAFAWYLRRR